ncbi:hypothetical protein AVEN_128909-1 [Araneus ventricosus]|uniref:Uncharacterized protein n=1 Tax=Araneus ventricosus TaxID=182803 RepID=A0A4Y2N0T1_ARAVE|nr:hypothetical protein AVEN_128909-1 [Araneus ventricosus]
MRSCKLLGTMAIQAGKSITSCPQLVFVPLTGLEKTLFSSLNMALSLSTSKGFTSLTAINAVVAELAQHYATECILSVSWHMRNNIIFRQKLVG